MSALVKMCSFFVAELGKMITLDSHIVRNRMVMEWLLLDLEALESRLWSLGSVVVNVKEWTCLIYDSFITPYY